MSTILPFEIYGCYTGGTVNVTNGSAVVTGNNTIWNGENSGNSVVNPGDIFTVDDSRLYFIVSVDSATQITLDKPYVGTSALNAEYRIVFQASAHFPADTATKVARIIERYERGLISWTQVSEALAELEHVKSVYSGAAIGEPSLFRTGEQPAGYLLMNGGTFSPTEYPTLYEKLGNTSTLPDWTSKVPASGWSYYIRAALLGDVMGEIEQAKFVVHTLETEEKAFAAYDLATNTLDIYIPRGLTGAQGPKGDKGDAFTFADFTPAQLELLRGPQGASGVGLPGPQGDKGPDGDPPVGLSWGGFEITEQGELCLNMYGLATGETMTGAINDDGECVLTLTTEEE